MKPCTVLFTSAGRRAPLVSHFRQTHRKLKLEGAIIAADLSRTAPALYVADVAEQVPPVNAPNYLDCLLDLCVRRNVQLLIPLIDTELLLLAGARRRFEAAGTKLLVSSEETNRICFDKRNTAEFFTSAGVRTPQIYSEDIRFPLFIKPASGSSSVGAMRIDSPRDLEFFSTRISDCVVQELIFGEEYTVDVLVDFDGSIVSTVPRLRMETRAGEVSKGMTVRHPEIIAATSAVVAALPEAVGCITVQCFLTPEQDIVFTEINPRFGGGHPLAIEAGADFPRWILQRMAGFEKPDAIDNWQDGLVMMRYDAAVFRVRQELGL